MNKLNVVTDQKLTIQKIVHKTHQENVLVKNICHETGTLSDGFNYEYVGDLVFDSSHSFFFEHERHHIPGLLLIEAGRQNSMAITHKFLDIPIAYSFIMNELNSKFKNFAQIEGPIKIYSSVSKQYSKSGRMAKCNIIGKMVQNGHVIIEGDGSFDIIPNRILKRIEDATFKKKNPTLN